MKDGFRVKYIPMVLTKGVCPDTFKQFFTQFYRWSTGSLCLMLDKSFWTSRLTLAQKVCFFTGFGFYTTTGLSALFAFVPSIYLMLFKVEYLHWFNVLWAVPSIILTNIYLRFWQKSGFSWSAIECRAVSFYAHLFALVDILFSQTEAWIPTGGVGTSQRYLFFKRFVKAHTLLLVISIFSLSAWRIAEGHAVYHFIPMWGLLAYHVTTLWKVLVDNN